MNLTASIVVLKTGKSVSDPFRRIYDTLLPLKTPVIKSGFKSDAVLKIAQKKLQSLLVGGYRFVFRSNCLIPAPMSMQT